MELAALSTKGAHIKRAVAALGRCAIPKKLFQDLKISRFLGMPQNDFIVNKNNWSAGGVGPPPQEQVRPSVS